MKEDGPELSDQDKRAIEAIRRELDREFGDVWDEAPIHPERSKRRKAGRHTGLVVGLGILAVVTLVAATAFVASRVPAPVPYGHPQESAAISGVDLAGGSGSAPVIDGDSGPVSMDLTVSPSARESRSHVMPGRTGYVRVKRSEPPCPPSTRVATPPRRPDASLASARRGSAARGDSRPSTVMALANPVREPRHVEAP
jgi:hypothetical protein